MKQPKLKTGWQPIKTAPKDGDVILTDLGTMCYVDPHHWGSPVTEGWWLCRINQQPDMNYEDGPDMPKAWKPGALD